MKSRPTLTASYSRVVRCGRTGPNDRLLFSWRGRAPRAKTFRYLTAYLAYGTVVGISLLFFDVFIVLRFRLVLFGLFTCWVLSGGWYRFCPFVFWLVYRRSRTRPTASPTPRKTNQRFPTHTIFVDDFSKGFSVRQLEICRPGASANLKVPACPPSTSGAFTLRTGRVGRGLSVRFWFSIVVFSTFLLISCVDFTSLPVERNYRR